MNLNLARKWFFTYNAADGTYLFGGRECAEFRHKHGLNAGYADGHAAWVREKVFPGGR